MPAVWGIQPKTGVLRGLCYLLFWRFAQTAFFVVRKQGVVGRLLSIDRFWNGVTTSRSLASDMTGTVLCIDRIFTGAQALLGHLED